MYLERYASIMKPASQVERCFFERAWLYFQRPNNSLISWSDSSTPPRENDLSALHFEERVHPIIGKDGSIRLARFMLSPSRTLNPRRSYAFYCCGFQNIWPTGASFSMSCLCRSCLPLNDIRRSHSFPNSNLGRVCGAGLMVGITITTTLD